MIQLDFTEEEFRKLMEVMYIADWVTNAHKIPDRKSNPYYALDQRIMAQAKAAGCGDLVEDPGKGKELFPSKKLEEKCHGTLDEYDNDTFWDELVNRLALRDIEEERGADALEAMSPEERIAVIGEMEERYQTETEMHGIDRLEIVEK